MKKKRRRRKGDAPVRRKDVDEMLSGMGYDRLPVRIER